MTAIILQADARQLPLPDDSVDLVVTSPPYFALRSYQDGGAHYDGQIGSETTPTEYLDTMVECIREWTRVLKPSGSIFINMGDKYAGAPSGPRQMAPGHPERTSPCKPGDGNRIAWETRRNWQSPTPAKSLLGVPQRLVVRCMDELHLIWRAEIIWAKPNGLPESVTDRVRRSHEQIFHFTLQPRYYSAVDEVREEHAGEFLSSGVRNPRYGRPGGQMPGKVAGIAGWDGKRGAATLGGNAFTAPLNPLGKLPGSVWSIPSSPLQLPDWLGVDHFAAYPPDLIRPIILGWSPPGICMECGEGRRPVVTKDRAYELMRRSVGDWKRVRNLDDGANRPQNPERPTFSGTIIGYVCACIELRLRGRQIVDGVWPPTRPAIVVDPFGGTGTTALVASTHGRIGVSVDLSHDYSRVARWRTHDPGERARALKVEKPPPVLDGQLDLLGDLA